MSMQSAFWSWRARVLSGVVALAGVASHAAQTARWGPTVNGLKCRMALPKVVEQGMNATATVELQADPATLPPGIRTLNGFMRDAYLTLVLTDAGTGKQFEVRAFRYPGPPIPLTDSDLLLLNQRLKPRKVNFPLVTVYSNLPPADYECRVSFTYSTNQPARGLRSATSPSNCWQGTIVSGTVQMQVMPETPRFQMFWIPKRLVVTKELINLHSPDLPPDLEAIPVIRFRKADVQAVSLPVRNGHFQCTIIERTGRSLFSGGGALVPDDANSIDTWYGYKGQDLTADYVIKVFEVAAPSGHLQIPGPYSPGYRSLWSKSFHVTMTAQQFRELPATVVNVPRGMDERGCVALIKANPEVEELELGNTGVTDADMLLVGNPPPAGIIVASCSGPGTRYFSSTAVIPFDVNRSQISVRSRSIVSSLNATRPAVKVLDRMARMHDKLKAGIRLDVFRIFRGK